MLEEKTYPKERPLESVGVGQLLAGRTDRWDQGRRQLCRRRAVGKDNSGRPAVRLNKASKGDAGTEVYRR